MQPVVGEVKTSCAKEGGVETLKSGSWSVETGCSSAEVNRC